MVFAVIEVPKQKQSLTVVKGAKQILSSLLWWRRGPPVCTDRARSTPVKTNVTEVFYEGEQMGNKKGLWRSEKRGTKIGVER